MNLPQIPYAMRKNRTQEITIRGLNLSAAVSDGDVADSANVSVERYPYVTEGKTDGEVADGALSAARFGRDIALVGKDNSLKVGDEVKGTLSGDGKRQMATVNSKLVVFPDRQYYDSSVEHGEVENLWAETEAAMLFASDRVSMLKGVDKCISGYGGALRQNEFNVELDSEIVTNDEFSTVAIGRTEGTDKIMGLIDLDSPELSVSKKGLAINSDTYEPDGNIIKCVAKDVSFGKGAVLYLICEEAAKYNDFYTVEAFSEGAVVNDSYHIYTLTLSRTGAKGYKIDFSGLSGAIKFYFPATPGNTAPLIRYRGNSVHRVSEIGSGVCYLEDANNNIDVTYYQNISGTGGNGADAFKWAHWRDKLTSIAESNKPATLYFPEIPYLITGTVKTTSSNQIVFSDLWSAPWLSAKRGEELVYLLSGDVSYADLTEFKVGDVVESSGITIDGVEANNTAFTIKSIDGATIHTTANAFTEGVANVGDKYTVSEAKLERRIPELDFICEANNRLYGCSNADNTIYVSALGDPTNMFAYEGVSTDSYAVAVADREPFTGCCRYGTDVLFFKENKIYKLVGSYPAEFALYSYDVEGVEERSHNSLCVINETLFYKGIHGVFAYTGGVPSMISRNLGDKRFTDACAGTDGVSYILSMKDEDGSYKRFSYDTRLGIWMAEGEGERRDVIRVGNRVYYISDTKLMQIGAGDNEGVEWLIQYAPIYETIEGKKTHSRILIRAEIPRGSYIRIDMRCDDGAWMKVGQVIGRCSGIVPIRIPVNRCDKFELKLSGKGKFTLQSMLREFYVGSEK